MIVSRASALKTVQQIMEGSVKAAHIVGITGGRFHAPPGVTRGVIVQLTNLLGAKASDEEPRRER